MISLFPASTHPNRLIKGHLLDRRSFSEGGCSMKISEDVRQYTAEQGIAEEEALAQGMEEIFNKFSDAGTKACIPT
jgi:hypothetical protein